MRAWGLRLVLLVGLLGVPLGAQGLRPHGTDVAGLGRSTAAEDAAMRAARLNRTAYTLPPEKLRKAIVLHQIDETLTVGLWGWTLVQLWLILRLGVAARMRDDALRVGENRWAQGFAFVFLLLLLTGLLDLPVEIYGHHVGLAYELSVEGWGAWLGDKAKMFGLEWGVGGLLAVALFGMIRRSPTRWWMWCWLPGVVVVVAAVFVTPYAVDPLFNTFEPLARVDPALVEQLEKVVARSGMSIPPERMFLMRASAKYTGANAYVTGFGASKRIVVWDTTIAGSTPDEIAFVFAHELGHYALGHVATGVALTCVALLPCLGLGYGGVRWLLRRYGQRWGVASQQDWAALPAMLLVFYALAFVAEPVSNGFSRAMEHAADVYGQEAVHGIVADPQEVGRRSFQELGEQSLDDPTPHPWFDLWFGTHPAIGFRAAFAKAYDPWAAGEHPKYF